MLEVCGVRVQFFLYIQLRIWPLKEKTSGYFCRIVVGKGNYLSVQRSRDYLVPGRNISYIDHWRVNQIEKTKPKALFSLVLDISSCKVLFLILLKHLVSNRTNFIPSTKSSAILSDSSSACKTLILRLVAICPVS